MGLYTLRTGATSHPEDTVLQLVTDLIETSGVLNVTSGDHFLVEAQASPDMTVKVNTGRAYIKGDTGNAYPIRLDADANVTITANSSGNPRIDVIVLYIDKSAAANTTASNIATLVAVAGTPAGSPTAPDDTAIQTAIGASNPYIILAEVEVANGASSITSGEITDVREQFTVSFSIIDFLKLSVTPSNPTTGRNLVYFKNNDLAKLDNSGVETLIANSDLWIDKTHETWTRTGNHSFTISGDVRTIYVKGTRIRYKDGGSYEYGTVKSSSYGAGVTTITLFSNTDFAMAAATITDNYISYGNPPDYPFWFNRTDITITGSGGSLGTFAEVAKFYRFYVVANNVHFSFKTSCTNKGSWSGNLRIELPATGTTSQELFFGNAINQGVSWGSTGAIVNYGPAYPTGGYALFKKALDTNDVQWSDMTAQFVVYLNGDYQF